MKTLEITQRVKQFHRAIENVGGNSVIEQIDKIHLTYYLSRKLVH